MNETLHFLRLPLLGRTQFERKPFVFLSVSKYLMHFVIKEIMANDFQCRVQIIKLNADGFTKLIFRG